LGFSLTEAIEVVKGFSNGERSVVWMLMLLCTIAKYFYEIHETETS
jgi:hypothetical protein